MSILTESVQGFREGSDLPVSGTESFFDALIGETNEELLREVFLAWDRKGITADEVFEIASVMRRRCTPVVSPHETFVDIVGTGGSRQKTFNVSTAAAFVIAGAGVPVAKHGNKAATSSSGSADVLSALGVEPAGDATTAERCLSDIGICFMFAPNFHRLSPILAKVRRGLGFPTIFNCVGPLCNPAAAPHQVIGVWKEELVAIVASALSRLGTNKSWIVHGLDGVDEVSITGPTLVAEVNCESVSRMEISAKDFGLQTARSDGLLRVGSPRESADLIREILSGNREDDAAERLVLCNAAAAIYLAGKVETLAAGLNAATDSIRSGRALGKLNQLVAATKG
ncbi:MAG: anthranilate phosphoribosyltransferase [Acidobacteriota bacterium]